MNDDVHQLRGIKLKGLKRDPSYFLGGVKVEKAHLEKCFDVDTLFYDIFFEPTNRYLVAVGPSLGNLRMALQLYVNGNLIELSKNIRHHRQFLVMGKVRRVEKLNDILIKANGQQWQLSVPENSTGTKHKFTLCTIQKDNREHWIKDWIEHYRKMGVDRVIIYDNNSEKIPDVDAIVIPCPYKYGLSKYIHTYGRGIWKTSFLHTGLLTICCYKYRSGHLLNFDVDELLQIKSLKKYKKRKLVYFDSYYMETKADEKLPVDHSFRHFVYRNSQLRNKNHKYMVKMDALLYATSPHHATLKRAASVLNRIVSKFCNLPQQHNLLSKDVFYHYKGLNTGWKWDLSHFDETTEVLKIDDYPPPPPPPPEE